MPDVADLLCKLIMLYIIAMFGRIILSWFPVSSDSPVSVVARVLYKVTEPVLGPVRRLLPPVRMGSAMLDLSPIVVLITLQVIVWNIILGCG